MLIACGDALSLRGPPNIRAPLSHKFRRPSPPIEYLRDSLHPILDEMKHVKGGFNIFRRFRITHLEKSDCPEALKHFWSGHAPAHVSERYVKLLIGRDYRLDWADRVGWGLCFQLANLAYCT